MYPVQSLPRPVALVLSGGVALGSIQVGMLRAILASGIRPDLLVGSSAGALNAAFIGQGFNESRVARLAEIWIGLKRSDVFGHFGLRKIFNIISAGAALASPEALHKLIATHVPSSFGDLTIPTFITATDYLSGEMVLLSRGNLWDSLLASSALPFVFPPVPIEDRYLVDGSISAHVPLLPAQQLGAETLVVLDVGYPCQFSELPKNYLDRALHVFSLMLHRQHSGILSALSSGSTVLYLPSPCPLAVPAYDFSHAADLIEAGYRVADQFLQQVVIKGPGVYGHPHSHAL